jgi:hypothetical protein
MNLRSDRRSHARVAAVSVLALVFSSPVAAELPDAHTVLSELGFSASDQQEVKGGGFVTTTLKPTSDREITAAMAFLVTTPPSKLIEQARHDVLLHTDPNTIASGKVHAKESAADFEGVTLTPNAKQRAALYLAAKPGDELNLSAAEIEAFGALKEKSGEAGAVLKQVRKSLLARYQAYRAKGLDGIADYQRGGGKATPAAGDLRRADEAASALKTYTPAFYGALVGYPNDVPEGFEERFDWSNYEAHGTPTFVLTHRFSMSEGDGFVLGQRQFYVSRGYNVMQALVAFLPVKKGTLVVYVNRTSTDQVTGFGGGSKRSIGSRVMASQLKSLYAKVRTEVEK